MSLMPYPSQGQRTLIKMCGMTRKSDVMEAVELGVDAVGIIFYKNSPRYVPMDAAATLIADVPAKVAIFGVFADEEAQTIRDVLAHMPNLWLQFHGNEDAVFCRQFSRPYIKTMAIKAAVPEQQFLQYPEARGFLADALVQNGYGGQGASFSWALLQPVAHKWPILMAGGLRSDNVEEAISLARPWGVDVASGIESAKGIKEATKMAAFVAAVRRADEQRTR